MLSPAIGLSPLDADARAALVRWLGDSPFSALTGGQVQSGLCYAYALGSPSSPEVALVQPAATPSEPIAFGSVTESIWSLLSHVPGWVCVNVALDAAAEVARLVERQLGMRSRILSERYYSLEQDPVIFSDPGVRSLGPGDTELVTRSDPLFRSFFLGHGDVSRTLAEGVVAGAVAGGTLLSAITTSAWVGHHVDLGAVTVPEARGRGLATAAAHRVCARLRGEELVPVWAAAESNPASWRIPEKLGFRFVGRRAYVVFDELRPRGYQPSTDLESGR